MSTKKPGRPPVYGVNMERVTVHIQKTAYDKLLRICVRRGLSVPEVIRKAVDAYVNPAAVEEAGEPEASAGAGLPFGPASG